MHELVRHTFHSKLLSVLRLPSFAGTGLPERMRSISFALLGLTAAAGLALVAIFAQPNFPLLAPAPLPAEPSAQESISAAKKLPLNHGSVALLTQLPVPVHPTRGGAGPKAEGPAGGTSAPGGVNGGSGESQVSPAEADVPAPVDASQPSDGNNGGGEGGNGTGGGSVPAPAATPQQPAASPSGPVSSPQPTKQNPEAVTSSPKPEPAPAPGNSSSTAAAEHASERGIEASGGAEAPASTAAVAEPESSAAPGNGNGLAKGHDK
jgi:hypothetical protein